MTWRLLAISAVSILQNQESWIPIPLASLRGIGLKGINSSKESIPSEESILIKESIPIGESIPKEKQLNEVHHNLF